MTDSLLSEIIRYVRSHTAFRAWLVEILILFVVFTLARAAIAVWLRWDTQTVQWWAKWLYAYDNLRAYADDALVAAILLVIIFEGGFMFLARKRIALSREEGHEEGLKVGHQAGHSQGIQEGRTLGHQEGHSLGHQEGRTLGVQEGHSQGIQEGVALGHQQGHSQGIQEGRAATEAELLPVIQELRERIRKLENGADASP